MEVLLSKQFKTELKNFPKADQEKIASFILHVQRQGMKNLPGKNKPSHDVPHDDPQWLDKVSYAQQHNLWHYHIGIPQYDTSCQHGEQTSEYILHYIKGDGFIKIVDFSAHPPFKLPAETYLY